MISATAILRLDIRKQTALILIAIWIYSLFFFKSTQVLISPLLAITFCICLEYLWNLYVRKIKYLSASALVTGLLIGLNLPFNSSLFQIVLIATLTIILKQFLKYKGRVIFNPAALGLLVGVVFFQTQISWWAASWSRWPLLLLLIIGQGYILKRAKRLWLTLTFLISYGIYLFFNTPGNILLLLLDGTVFFFAFIMLPEPQTSPNLKYWQYLFGPLVVLHILFFSYFRLEIDPFILSLLAANGESLLVRKLHGEI